MMSLSQTIPVFFLVIRYRIQTVSLKSTPRLISLLRNKYYVRVSNGKKSGAKETGDINAINCTRRDKEGFGKVRLNG